LIIENIHQSFFQEQQEIENGNSTSQRSASITDNYNTIPSNPQEPPLPPNNSTNIVTINSDDSSSDSESSIDDDGEDRMDHEDPRQNKER